MMRLSYLVTALLGVASADAAEQLQEFGYSSAIEMTAGDALYTVQLPKHVYQHVTRQDLSDLRVFNAAGEAVPYALRRPNTQTADAAALQSLPLFPVTAKATATSNNMDVEVRSDGTVVRVRGAAQTKAAESKPEAYLLDASRLESSLSVKALDFAFAPSGNNVIAKVMIEGSDDLKGWDIWVAEAPLLQTEFNGQRLQQLRVEFPARRAKYLRVSAVGGIWEHQLQSITPIGASSIVEPERTSATIKGVAAKESGVFLYELGALLPVDRINVRLTENNAVARFELESRHDDKAQWQRFASGVAFRLNQNGQTLVSPGISVSSYVANSYRLSVTPASSVAPELEVQWVPHELVFAARGNPPFTLAYGKAGVATAALAMDSLVPGYGTNSALKPKPATLGSETALAGATALKAPPAYGRYGLWAVLVLGAAVLGYMGLRLAKEAPASKT